MVSGADARAYLQGQLTADLDALGPNQVQLACCNSPQGRVQAVLWMIERSDGIALLLPAAMVEATLAPPAQVRAAGESEDRSRAAFAGRRSAPRAALPAHVTCREGCSHRESRRRELFHVARPGRVMLLGAFARSRDATERASAGTASTFAPACRRYIPKPTKRSWRRCSTSICSAASASRRVATPARKSSPAPTSAAP